MPSDGYRTRDGGCFHGRDGNRVRRFTEEVESFRRPATARRCGPPSARFPVPRASVLSSSAERAAAHPRRTSLLGAGRLPNWAGALPRCCEGITRAEAGESGLIGEVSRGEDPKSSVLPLDDRGFVAGYVNRPKQLTTSWRPRLSVSLTSSWPNIRPNSGRVCPGQARSKTPHQQYAGMAVTATGGGGLAFAGHGDGSRCQRRAKTAQRWRLKIAHSRG
jgi:hypothetical protein